MPVLPLDEQVAQLTLRTGELLDAINIKKSFLDAAVANAGPTYDAVVAARDATLAAAATTATNSTNAAASETNAATSATNAAASATAANTSKNNAATSATNAATSETNASTSAANALSSSNSANTYKTAAQDWATKTSGEVVTGQGYGAKKYANDAAASATTASTQAGTATTQAGNAATSATLAQNWATQTNAEVVINQGYGAKKYAIDAAASAASAAASADLATSGQVNSDWNATTGKAQILNKPIISEPNVANTVVQRDVNGDISTRNFVGSAFRNGTSVYTLENFTDVPQSGLAYRALTSTTTVAGILSGIGGVILSTASVERMRVTAAGFVGVGTKTPLSKLSFGQVSANLNSTGVPGSAPVLRLYDDNTSTGTVHGIGVNSASGNMEVSANQAGSGIDFFAGTANNAPTVRMSIGPTGVVNVPGSITTATPSAGTNNTTVATTAYVRGEINALVASSPSTLDTLNELATALGNDPNFATTTATALGLRARTDTANNFAGKQQAKVDNQTSYTNSAIVSEAAAGNAMISLLATGSTAASIKHVRGVNGIQVVGSDGTTLVPVTGSTLNGSSVVSTGDVAGSNGFTTTTSVANARNPIFKFGNADGYGISFFTGTAGRGSLDTIAFHFNATTAAASSFSVNTTGAYYGNNLMLHAGNVSSYAPSLTGVGASGTWPINISGTLNNHLDQDRSTSDLNTRLTNGTSGLDATNANAPAGSAYAAMLLARNSDTGIQILGGYSTDNMWFRGWSGSGSSFTAWRKVIHDGNIGTQAVATAAKASKVQFVSGDVNGTTFNWTSQGGTPTWFLGGTASDNIYVYSAANFTVGNSSNLGGFPSSYTIQKKVSYYNNGSGRSLDSITESQYGFAYVGQGNNSGPFLHFGGLGGGGDYPAQFSLNYGATSSFKFRTRNDDSGAVWNGWREVWHDQNLNPQITAVAGSVVLRNSNGFVQGSYVHMSDEGSATAGTVTAIITKRGDDYYRSTSAVSVKAFLAFTGNEITTQRTDRTYDLGIAKELRWDNYGNGHTIFDASKSLSPSGAAISNTNPSNAWSPTFPTLMGWNGSSTYGVRVDNARTADQLAGYVKDTAGSASTIAQRDSGGALTATNFIGAGTGLTGTANSLLAGASMRTELTPQYTWSASTLPNSYNNGMQLSFVSAAEGWFSYGNVINVKGYGGGPGSSMQTYIPYGTAYGGTDIKFRLADQAANAWGPWRTYIDSSNIGNQSVFTANKLIAAPAHTDGTSGWFRSDGAAGWYSETYGGGIYMTDTTYVRTYNGKSFWSDGDIVAYSDERLKTNWVRPSAKEFIKRWAKVKAGSFDRTDMDLSQDGVSAQDVQKIQPNSVRETKGGEGHEDKDGLLVLNYGGATAVASVMLSEVVDEHEDEINSLKLQVAAQGAAIETLKRLVEELTSKINK